MKTVKAIPTQSRRQKKYVKGWRKGYKSGYSTGKEIGAIIVDIPALIILITLIMIICK
jgi:hypothetical protein